MELLLLHALYLSDNDSKPKGGFGPPFSNTPIGQMVNSKKVITLIKQGKNFSEVAREMGCARNTVKSTLYRYLDKQASYVAITAWGLSDKDKRRIIDAREDGLPVQAIAADFGISISYVYKIVQRGRNASR